jgi:hypothetical protein
MRLALALAALIVFSGPLPAAGVRENVQGVILEQNLANDQGVTVLHVWGSHYEMGYAHGVLLADWIQLSYTQMRAAFSAYWPTLRTLVSGWTFLPAAANQEFQGIYEGMRSVHPETTADIIDLKVCSTFGDWAYAMACRSTSCWDEWVEPPFTTLSARKLQFYTLPASVTQQWHHVICAWEPNDGTPAWVNFGFPGYATCVTGVNEHGTVASLHDWNSSSGTNWPDALPRTMACRWVLTMDLGPDPSTHLQTAFAALQPYHAAAGGFLNYYVPDGGAGVIKSSKSLGFYAVRLPRPEYMNGHSMSTNNSDIDGTVGIEPWQVYYQTLDPSGGVRATMTGLWNCAWEATDMHVVEVGFRDTRDMTIWFRGRLQSSSTARVEWDWANLFREAASVEADGETTPPRGMSFPNPSCGKEITFAFQTSGPRGKTPNGWKPRRLEIFDVAGHLVRVLESADRPRDAAEISVIWDGRDAQGRPVPSGAYTGRLAESGASSRVIWIER